MTAFSRLGIEPIRFWSVDREIDFHAFRRRCFNACKLQWLRLGVGINRYGCCHNSPNVLNRRQIRWIRRPVLRRNVVFNICVQLGDCSLWCLRTSAVLLKHSFTPFTVMGKQLCCSASLHAAEPLNAGFTSLFKYVVSVIIKIDIHFCGIM